MLELYRPDSEVVGLFRAPDGDEPEPILVREIGRCISGVPASPPAMRLPDASIP